MDDLCYPVPVEVPELRGEVFLKLFERADTRRPVGSFTMHITEHGIAGEVFDLHGRKCGCYANGTVCSCLPGGTDFQSLTPPFWLGAFHGDIVFISYVRQPLASYTGCAEGALAAFLCLDLLRLCRDNSGFCILDADCVDAYFSELDAHTHGEYAKTPDD